MLAAVMRVHFVHYDRAASCRTRARAHSYAQRAVRCSLPRPAVTPARKIVNVRRRGTPGPGRKLRRKLRARCHADSGRALHSRLIRTATGLVWRLDGIIGVPMQCLIQYVRLRVCILYIHVSVSDRAPPQRRTRDRTRFGCRLIFHVLLLLVRSASHLPICDSGFDCLYFALLRCIV